MGLLLDTVPNHMAASAGKSLVGWMSSKTAPSRPLRHSSISNGTLMHAAWMEKFSFPFSGVLSVRFSRPAKSDSYFRKGRFFFQYFDALFPLAPRSYHTILDHHAGQLRNLLGEDAPVYHEYAGILASLLELVRSDRRSGETAADRRLRYESARDRLFSLVKASAEVAGFVDENVREINGKDGDPASFGFMQQVLADQNYKLSFWQNLNESINYRRFFTITELVGVRVEDPHVFEATHGYVLRLVARTPHAGLRIDHIDGLRDPLAYLNKLQERLASRDNREDGPSYIVVEKILALEMSAFRANGRSAEPPAMDYLNEASGVFVDPEGAVRIEKTYSEFNSGREQKFADVVYHKKKLVMSTLLGVEMRTPGQTVG